MSTGNVRQFFETSDGKLVNLDNVTNIVFDPDFTDRFGNKRSKIIFNLDYHLSLPRSDKKVADYVYSVYTDKNEYQESVKKLNELVNRKSWIAPITNNTISKVINPDKISFMTKDDDNYRVILNLNTSVSFYGDYQRLTSDFVYLNFYDDEEYQNNLTYITELLKQWKF
jgi:hypothetical protein